MRDRLPDQNDESQRLVLRAREGDESALWQLTNDWRPYLKKIVRGELGNELSSKLDESDVVQRSMVHVVKRFDDFRGENVHQWQAWLKTIVRNEVHNVRRYWRQQKRTSRGERPVDDLPQLQADQSTPSQSALRRERASRLLQTIEQLTPEQQDLVKCRHFQGMSHAEIAQRLNISEDACRQRWKSVLEKLAKLWDDGE